MNRISHIAPLFGTSLTARSAGGTAPGKRIIVFSNRQKGTSHLLPAGWVLQDYLRYGAAGLATLLAARSGYANLAPLLGSTPPPLLPPPPPSPASRLYAMMLPFLSRVKTFIAGTAFVGGSGVALLGGAALLQKGEKSLLSSSVADSTSRIPPANRSPVSPFTINSSSSTTPPVSPSPSNSVHSSPVLSPGTSTTEVPTNLEESTSANSSSSTTPPVTPSPSNSVHSSPVFQPNTSKIEIPTNLEESTSANSSSSTTPPVSPSVSNSVHSSPVFQPNTSNIEIPEIDLENTPLSNGSSSTTPPVSSPVSNSVHPSPVLSPGTSTTEVPTNLEESTSRAVSNIRSVVNRDTNPININNSSRYPTGFDDKAFTLYDSRYLPLNFSDSSSQTFNAPSSSSANSNPRNDFGFLDIKKPLDDIRKDIESRFTEEQTLEEQHTLRKALFRYYHPDKNQNSLDKAEKITKNIIQPIHESLQKGEKYPPARNGIASSSNAGRSSSMPSSQRWTRLGPNLYQMGTNLYRWIPGNSYVEMGIQLSNGEIYWTGGRTYLHLPGDKCQDINAVMNALQNRYKRNR